MGYPMTYQRVLNRNRLKDGDYQESPPIHINGMTKGQIENLLGDLRRLEQDTQDENALVKHIQFRTNIDPEVIAAVLKEFINW